MSNETNENHPSGRPEDRAPHHPEQTETDSAPQTEAVSDEVKRAAVQDQLDERDGADDSARPHP